ncbi:TELO2-interacting protein 1 homolog [Bacillus rossius redtenbacheri]|uniref:TELO2-interacting protein 1 homolog n=1 Tax=Bacillus rossius redtenbacheri TaxID=93214 RepID=UPI002FDEEBB9
MTEMADSNAFEVLKPACTAVACGPSVETVLHLRSQLDLVPTTALQQLQNYVFFPLLLHVRNSAVGSDVRQHLIDCIAHVLKKTKIVTVMQLFEIYVPLFLHLFDASKPSLLASVAEETKLCVVKCVTQLLSSATPDTLAEVYQTKYVPRLGQGIYICMELLKSERMRSLRLAVIQCVMVHCRVETSAFFESSNLTFRHQVADIISVILPGILVGLLKVITGDPKVGHEVIRMAVRAWGNIIALVFEDRTGSYEEPTMMNWHLNNEEEAETDYERKSTEELQQILLNPQERHRWACSTGRKVAQHMELAVRVQSSDDWRVRLELVQVSHLILVHCARTLQSSQLPLMEVLVASTVDSTDAVAAASSAALAELAQLPLLTSALEENFYKVAESLPRVIRSAGEKEQLSAVRLLTGHLRLLGHRLPQVLSSHVHLEKLVLALVKAFQLSTCGISPLEAGSAQGTENMEIKIFGIGAPWKQYEYFTDQQVLDCLESACSLLGQFSDLEILIHYFLDMLSEWPEHRKEITLILNQILLTSLKTSHVDVVSLARTVINVYIDPDLWSLPLSVDTHVTLNEARSNVVQACLLVEGIGKVATALGRQFRPLLLKTLYAVLERCGSAQPVLRAAGVEAAQGMAAAFGYPGVTGLVRANQDYVSFHVSRRLLRVRAHPGALDVLAVVLAHSDREMLPHLQGIAQEVLLLNVGTSGDKRAVPFLRVFLASMKALRRWSGQCEAQVVEIDKTDKSAIANLLEYHAKRTKVLSLMEEDDEVNDSAQASTVEEEQTESEKKETVPPLILLADQILQRSVHFLPTKDRTQCLIVLETLTEGVKLLEPHTNQLLPIVHHIWSPLVGRLTQWSDIVIMRRSFELLRTLALTARDFIRSRTLKDVLPKMWWFLSKRCAGNRRGHGAPHAFAQEFKLQQELLEGLGSLVECLELSERDVDGLLSVVLPYLSREQPQPLQTACVQLLKQLTRYDPDAVWLRLTGLLVSCKVSANQNHLYEKNVHLVLQCLESCEEIVTC